MVKRNDEVSKKYSDPSSITMKNSGEKGSEYLGKPEFDETLKIQLIQNITTKKMVSLMKKRNTERDIWTEKRND